MRARRRCSNAPAPALPTAPDTTEAPPHRTACDAQGDLQKANNALQTAEDTLGRYVGTAECTVKDPTAFPIIEISEQRAASGHGLTLCARRELDAQLSDAGSKIQREMQDVGQALAIAGARMKTQQAVLDAQKAVADAKKAKNVDDAKAAAKAGGDAAKTAREALRIASNECIRTTLKQVEDLADLAQIQVDLRQTAPDSMCGGGWAGASAQNLRHLRRVGGRVVVLVGRRTSEHPAFGTASNVCRRARRRISLHALELVGGRPWLGTARSSPSP